MDRLIEFFMTLQKKGQTTIHSIQPQFFLHVVIPRQ